MTQKPIIFAVLVLLFISCSILNNSDAKRNHIVGKWRWIRSTGGLFPRTTTPDSAGSSEYFITYSISHTFSFTRADTVFRKGLYSFETKGDATVIYYQTEDQYFFPDQTVQFKSRDTLILLDRCADCFRNVYVRVR